MFVVRWEQMGKQTDEEEASEHLLVLQATTSYLVSALVLL